MKVTKLKNISNIMLSNSGDFFGKCSYCRRGISKNKMVLLISRPDYPGKIAIHINCIEDFAKAIVKFRKDNLKDLIMEELTEGS